MILTGDRIRKYGKASSVTDKAYDDAQDHLNRIVRKLLGSDYYIIDPVDPNTANEIIADDLIERYKKRSLIQKIKEFIKN